MPDRQRFAVLILILAAAMAAGEVNGQSQTTGAVCIAPFKTDFSGPQMLMDRPAPGAHGKYSFRFDKKLKATVGSDERRLITDVPADRKVLVEVRLDGKPTENFWIDLSKDPENRVCLWLYEGYWNWQVDHGWHWRRACRCDIKDTASRSKSGAPTSRSRSSPTPPSIPPP